jgi:hypothetical protein
MARVSRYKDHPDYVSSSFYVPKATNIRFDKAILDLKAEGKQVNRSEVLSYLMAQWASYPVMPPE